MFPFHSFFPEWRFCSQMFYLTTFWRRCFHPGAGIPFALIHPMHLHFRDKQDGRISSSQRGAFFSLNKKFLKIKILSCCKVINIHCREKQKMLRTKQYNVKIILWRSTYAVHAYTALLAMHACTPKNESGL